MAGLGAAATAGALVAATSPGAAAATEPNPWEPFSACPVNSAAMLEADISPYGIACVASASPHGTFTIGSTAVTTGSTDVQFGVAGSERDNGQPDADLSFGNVVPASGGQTLVAAPAAVPGGLLDLEHVLNPDGGAKPVGLGGLLGKVGQTVDSLLPVQAQVELAGAPRDFNASAALVPQNGAVFALPIKIHLISPALGNTCYIGSDANPIVLHPETITRGDISSSFKQYTHNDSKFSTVFLTLSGSTLGDDSFAVPAATGCGLLGLLNGAVNSKVGLPSPAGQNSLVLDDVAEHTALASGIDFTPADFAWAWNTGMQ